MTDTSFSHKDVVWCKCAGLFWPGEVHSLESLPDEIRDGFLKTPLVVVKFFDEDVYEFVLNSKDVHPYNCDKKEDFIRKGLARARTKAKEGVKDGYFAKFPKDVIYCEQITNGNPNILNEEPFAEPKKKDKVDYSLIFGDPEEIKAKKDEILQKSVIKKIRSRETGSSSPKPITHPRFLGHSDHTVRILARPSTPYHVHSGEETVSMTRDDTRGSSQYTCAFCDFASSRVNVMLMHSKSHSEPSKTNLANFSKVRPGSETRVRLEVKGSRLFADAKASLTKKRKLTYTPTPKSTSESQTKKAKVVKAKSKVSNKKEVKDSEDKEEKEEKQEKKQAIFGDWSEEEEEEEKEKLKESINIIADQAEDSDDDFFSFKTNKQIEEEQKEPVTKESARPLRERKKSVEKQKTKTKLGKKKVKKRQTVSDAVKSLLNTSLKSDDLVSTSIDETSDDDIDIDNRMDFSDNYDEHESSAEDPTSPPPSPPPRTPSKRPVILKKSSTRSFQLPTRPDGKLELIRHDNSTSETKFAGITAKARAKQQARSQMSNNELFDKLLETETSSSSVNSQKDSDDAPTNKVDGEKPESSKDTFDTFDFDCDSELVKTPSKMRETVAEEKKNEVVVSNPVKSPSKTKIVETKSPLKDERSSPLETKSKSPKSIEKSPIKDQQTTRTNTKSPKSIEKSPVKEQQINETNNKSPNFIEKSPNKDLLSNTKEPKPEIQDDFTSTIDEVAKLLAKEDPVEEQVEKVDLNPVPSIETIEVKSEKQKTGDIIVNADIKSPNKTLNKLDKSSPLKYANHDLQVKNDNASNSLNLVKSDLVKKTPTISKVSLPKSASPNIISKPNVLQSSKSTEVIKKIVTVTVSNKMSTIKPVTTSARSLIHGTINNSKTIVLDKPAQSQIILNKSPPKKIIIEKPAISSPKIQNDAVIRKPVVANVSKITLEKPRKPMVQQKQIVVNSEKPVVAGLKPVVGGIGLGGPKISKNIVLSKPVVPQNPLPSNSSSPLKVESKIVTVTQKQETPIKSSTPKITLATPKKEDKPLTISLESKKTTIKPIVKTVEIPKRAAKVLGNKSGPVHGVSSVSSKPVVHLDKSEKSCKNSSVEIKLDTKPSIKLDTKTTVKLDSVSAAPAPTFSVANVASLPVTDAVDVKLNGSKLDSIPTIVEGLELVNDVPVADADGEMIYLLVDDGTDPNLENQTLYIDPSQLAAAAGGLVLQQDGGLILQSESGVPVLLQAAGAAGSTAASQTGQIILQNAGDAGSALSNLVILDEKEESSKPGSIVTSADTTGGMATLPAFPSSSLSQIPLITTSSQQGPIMVSSMAKDEKK